MNLAKNGLVVVLLIGVACGVYLLINGRGSDTTEGTGEMAPLWDPEGKPGDLSVSQGTTPPGGTTHYDSTAAPGGSHLIHNVPAAGSPNVSVGLPSSTSPGSLTRTTPPATTIPAPADASANVAATTANPAAGHQPGNPASTPHPLGSVVGGPPSNKPPGTSTFLGVWEDAHALLRQGNLGEAHLRLSGWYGDPRLTGQQQEQLVDLLGQLAGTVFYSTKSVLEGDQHTVRYGETLEEIGKRYHVPGRLLAKINGIDVASVNNPRALKQGEQLKVVQGPFHALIDLKDNWVTVTLHSRYAGRFRITQPGRELPLGRPPTNLTIARKKNDQGELLVDFGGGIAVHSTGAANLSGVNRRDSIPLNPTDAAEFYDMISDAGPRRSQATVRR